MEFSISASRLDLNVFTADIHAGGWLNRKQCEIQGGWPGFAWALCGIQIAIGTELGFGVFGMAFLPALVPKYGRHGSLVFGLSKSDKHDQSIQVFMDYASLSLPSRNAS